MGAAIVEAIIEPFTSFGTGMATMVVTMFDALFKTSDGALTTIAGVGFALVGVGIVLGLGKLIVGKVTKRI